MTEILTLRAADMRCELVPALGASLAGLWLGDREILRHRPAPQMHSGLDGASYPLVPYSNRIGHRALHWAGQHFELAPNFPQEPHCIHGVGWMRPWHVMEAGGNQAVLRYQHGGDAHWPFAFDSEQRFVLQPDALEMHMHITNRAGIAAPAGLGWHPYFAKTAATRIRFTSVRRWEMATNMLPTQPLAHAGLDTDCSGLTVDHCFDGWSGALQLIDSDLQVEVTSDLTRLVVYTTPARDSIAVEPVSQVNNALALADSGAATLQELGMQVLQPGQTLAASMRIRVEKTA